MKILAVNAGSSSLKFQLYEMPSETVLISGVFERIAVGNSFYRIKKGEEKFRTELDLPDYETAVRILTEELLHHHAISSLEEIEGIGHRVVHGGEKYSDSVVIDSDVALEIEKLCELAPLHNPANLKAIQIFQKLVPNATAIAVFDTAFHQSIPKKNYLYAVPYEWYEKYGVRKYGFHGISHKYLSERLQEETGNPNLKLITCHLGNGASISAIDSGNCIDTSMGFTPNAGLVMGSRSGDIDTTILPYIMKKTNQSIDSIINDLNKKGGILGISGISSDMRDVEDSVEKGDTSSILAFDMYIKAIVSYIARYHVELGGADVIAFTAGVGENSAYIRSLVMKKLAVLGVCFDEEANNIRGIFRKISTNESSITCYVVPTDEEVMIARDTYKFIK